MTHSISQSHSFNQSKAYHSLSSSKLKMARRPLCIIVSLLMSQVAMAETTTGVESQDVMPEVELETIVVTADAPAADEATKTVVRAQDIQDNLINDQQDLVRYNPEVSVAEVGRYGSKGFAIRGVDGNRVAMSYDGVSLPDQQINQVFSAYGYMYEGRFNPDTELLSDVDLQVGADSFTSGSGALGGAVNYESKNPSDLIEPGKQLGGYAKVGYATKNEEAMTAVGLAGSTDKVEALVNYVYREGHELKNHRMLKFNSDKLDPTYDFGHDPDYRYPQARINNYRIGDQDNPANQASILPDPQHYESHATLAKAYVHLNDEHRIGAQTAYQYRLNKSNNFARRTPTTSDKRIGYDEAELTNYGINYRYLPLDSSIIDEINTDVSYQKVVGVANTFNYSDEGKTLGSNRYRPQYDTTKQINAEGYFLPIVTPSMGTHTLSANAKYSTSEHELIMREWVKLTGKDLYRFEFVGPSVETNNFSLAIADDINLSDQLSARLGVRYDKYNYQPYMTDINIAAVSDTGEFYPIKEDYEAGKFEQEKNLDNLGGLLALNYQITPNWQTGYKLSTGFLAPSTSQLYSAYEILGNNLTPNPDLNAEKSLNHELSLRGDFDDFSISATGFYTDYSDFIDTVYFQRKENRCVRDASGQKLCPDTHPDIIKPFIVNYISAQNIGSAKSYGVRLGGLWNITKLANTNGQINLTAEVSYNKGETEQGTSLLATQPPTGILGVNYLSANEDYQINAKMRYLGAKEPNDAKVVDFIYQGHDQFSKEVIVPYEHIDKSKTAVVYDIYGSKAFDNGLKLSAGIYNVFDKKYVPWDSLRTLAELNVNSLVDDEGRGVERYTAPGRNYTVALTYEF